MGFKDMLQNVNCCQLSTASNQIRTPHSIIKLAGLGCRGEDCAFACKFAVITNG